MLKKQAAALTVAGLIAATASFDSRAQSGTVNLTALDLAYQENFDTLAIAGTSSLLPAGWEILETGTNANLTYTAGTGSGNAGDTYSFGSAAATDRALGGLLSGSLTPLFGVAFANNTGQLITSLDVSFTGEQWRLGTAGRADRLDFQYSLDATALDNGTWTSLDALDFVSPATSVDWRAGRQFCRKSRDSFRGHHRNLGSARIDHQVPLAGLQRQWRRRWPGS